MTQRQLTTHILIQLIVLACLFMSPIASAQATSFHSLESIRENSLLFLQKQMEGRNISATIEIGQLDPRLKLTVCPFELEIFSPYGKINVGTGTVGVRCNSDQPWTIYVPISINGSGDVVTLSRNVKRGDILTAEDLTIENRDLARINAGYYTDPQEVIGQQLRRPLMRGAILMQFQLEEPKLIKRGQEVFIVADSTGISVKMRGTAMMDGKEGDRVKVRNLTSRRIIEGVVISTNTVKVGI
jgi:flagella basal body P-ring formation protein FlgA